MNKTLSKVNPEKRKRIINCALEEFSKTQFEHASTNEIVEKSKISKGLLFHYFGTKKKLYNYLIEFSCEYVIELFENGISWEICDFFKRVDEIMLLKLSAVKDYPYIYNFLNRTIENRSIEDIKFNFSDRLAILKKRIYSENIDNTLFCTNLDTEKAKDVIRWTIEGATEKLWKDIPENLNLKNTIMKEHKKYMDILRSIMYQ